MKKKLNNNNFLKYMWTISFWQIIKNLNLFSSVLILSKRKIGKENKEKSGNPNNGENNKICSKIYFFIFFKKGKEKKIIMLPNFWHRTSVIKNTH